MEKFISDIYFLFNSLISFEFRMIIKKLTSDNEIILSISPSWRNRDIVIIILQNKNFFTPNLHIPSVHKLVRLVLTKRLIYCNSIPRIYCR